ncbi:hypothetical protein ASPBRDRAFT_53135 [Aspergillus brasiliensis CBS 101740]|uniref:Uncharacterized protein n=1 Tax=Aspergillus brasiliensis (strain CBS 101740 / IMI 381727 / IBT 21946) TaxID=767769 RepID=A0A1L9UUD8_ASPBC|nr:hypothetical protein ASPBRDRAFT_53135 [Aspergillus brasiliensis CBS 101740]
MGSKETTTFGQTHYPSGATFFRPAGETRWVRALFQSACHSYFDFYFTYNFLTHPPLARPVPPESLFGFYLTFGSRWSLPSFLSSSPPRRQSQSFRWISPQAVPIPCDPSCWVFYHPSHRLVGCPKPTVTRISSSTNSPKKMSTQQDPNPSNEGKHEGLSKYVKRMKMALRRSSTVKTTSPTIQKQKEPEPSQAPAPQRIPLAPTVKATPDATVFTNWGAIQEEKARALFAKYGLTLEPGEWRSPSDTTVQRVVRPIRMRVRRTCHRCQTTFGPNKVCVNCQHVRCKSCPRHPSTKTNDHRDDTQAALQAIVAQKLHKPAPVQHKPKQAPLTLPSRTGGQDVIHHPTRQRIHRTCHQCSTPFAPDATECSTCQHIRCTMCPRDPPKLGKYPHGYPGDVDAPAEPPARTWKKARQRVRYTCHKCSTLYRSGERNCSNCGQEKGPETIRDPPRRDKPKPDPEIVRRVEERLAKLRLFTYVFAPSPYDKNSSSASFTLCSSQVPQDTGHTTMVGGPSLV